MIDATGVKDSESLAAIDIGSNSFHLIVARLTNGTLQPLVQNKVLVRLADGLDENNRLSEDAINRGLEALQGFAETVENISATNIRVVATYTLRRAKNQKVFLQRAKKIFPFPVEVITGDEEARLIYQGIAHTHHTDGKRLIIDIGGGSTEFAIGENFSHLQLSSQPMGCISYTKRFFADGEITLSRFEAAETSAQQRLEVIDQRFCNTGWQAAIGSSGTAKAIAQYILSKGQFEQGTFTLADLLAMRQDLIQAGHTEKIKGIDENRKTVIAAGLAIMIAAFKSLDIQSMGLADAALREGVLYELTERMEHQDIRERTVNSLVLRYDIDQQQSARVLATAEHLFSAYKPQINSGLRKAMALVLDWSIQLHEIGLHINRRAIQRHSRYILENIEMPGFSNEDQKILGLLVGSYRKRFQPADFDQFSQYEESQVFILVVILRLSTLLHQRRLDNHIPDFSFTLSEMAAQLSFSKDWLAERPLVAADLQTESEFLQTKGFTLDIS